MDSNVVKFPFSVSRRAHARRARISKNGTPEELVSLRETDVEEIRKMVREEISVRGFDDQPAPVSATAANSRLRTARRGVWWSAEAAVDYWDRRIKFDDAIERVQRFGLPEGCSHPIIDDPLNDFGAKVKKWRAAIVKQLLTPAPDANAVKWKQNVHDDYLDVKRERVEQAIAEDLAWLAAHPVRQSNRRRQG
jgi:hypothetical protein